MTANTVVVHDVTETVLLAFKERRDGDSDDRHTKVEPGDSPFTISGVDGIRANSLYRVTPDGGTESTINVIAIR
jgi:hypothetical protein